MDILWCTSSRRQYQLPTNQLTVGNDQVTPVSSVRNLGIYMDADLSMRTHVLRTAVGCFAVLRRIKSIRLSLTKPVLQSLVVALTLSRLAYGSTVLFGLPQQLVDKLQFVENDAARLIYMLPVVATTSARCCRVFTGCGLLTVSHFVWRYSPTAAFTVQHLSTCRDNCSEFLMFTHVNDFVLRRPLFWLFRGPVAQPLAVEVSLLLRPQSGTACQKQSVLQHLYRCSESRWRRNCSRDPALSNFITNYTSTWLTVSFFLCSLT